jgi:hypothetical protein
VSRLRYVVIMLVLALLVSGAAHAQDQEPRTQRFTGYLDSRVPMKEYPLPLVAGQAVLILAEATSGDLDTVIYLLNPEDEIVASNDDRSDESLDSALGYVVGETGEYTLQVTRYEGTDTSGYYRVMVTIGDESVLDELDSLTRLQLSGTMQTLDTPHFRIHYTFEGDDAVEQTFLDAVASTVEEVWTAEIEQMGWPPPPDDGVIGGDNRYDIYLKDIVGTGEGSLGYTSPESIAGDNPNTPDVVEERAGSSYIAVENDFRNVDGGTAISLMRATIAHEFNHAIQFGFDVSDPLNWYYEATAAWMETASLTKDEDATGYISYTYEYPELCLGTENDPGEGQLMYGDWTFMQTLVDLYGADAVEALWSSIAKYDSFDALAHMLEAYNANVDSVVATFRLKNLARDFALAPEFEATVWLENTITEVGRWTFTGEGIQELGANYFRVNVDPGVYYAGLVNDGGLLDLWAVGVTSDKVEAIPLGRGGNFDSRSYEDAYLMVFNPQYDNDVTDCEYHDYDIDVTPAKGDPGHPVISFPSRHFEPLG